MNGENMAKQLITSKEPVTRVQAHMNAQGKGLRVASNALLDEHIMKLVPKVNPTPTGRQGKSICPEGIFGEPLNKGQQTSVHALEILVMPPPGKNFAFGDIQDTITGTLVPYMGILPLLGERSLFEVGIALAVVPAAIDYCRKTGSHVVLPEKITVLGNAQNPFIQKADMWVPGKPEENTKIPLAISSGEFAALSIAARKELRWLRRPPGQSVRPIVRFSRINLCAKVAIDATGTFSDLHMAAFEKEG
jgi:hypothetical protein